MTTNPIYLALDVPRLDAAEALARKVAGHVGGLKLGLEFFCAHGHHGVHEIAKIGLPIFLDLKLHDIPNTVAAAMQSIHVLEPAIVTVHASGGQAMMEDAKAAAGEHCKVVAVTLLTSLDDGDLAATGVNGNAHDQVMRLADLAHKAGLDGIVCSGHEVEAVHRQWKDGFFVVPGLRPDVGNGGGKANGDQKRTVTPRAARDGGASVLVVGAAQSAAPKTQSRRHVRLKRHFEDSVGLTREEALRRIAIVWCGLLLGTSPLAAAPIEQFTVLPAADRADINRLETVFFDSITQLGTEKGLIKFFTAMGAQEKLTPEIVETFKQIDQHCGGLGPVERFKSEHFGSRVVRDTFVAVHGSCFVKWDLSYVKRGTTWGFDRFNFVTLDGNQW